MRAAARHARACQAALASELLLVPLGLDAQQNMTVELEPLVWQKLQARGLGEVPKETVWRDTTASRAPSRFGRPRSAAGVQR